MQTVAMTYCEKRNESPDTATLLFQQNGQVENNFMLCVCVCVGGREGHR